MKLFKISLNFGIIITKEYPKVKTILIVNSELISLGQLGVHLLTYPLTNRKYE